MPYLAKAHITRFRCLHDVEIEFTPLTVLVGPNASGKSSVLRALQPRAWSRADVTFREQQGTVAVDLEDADKVVWRVGLHMEQNRFPARFDVQTLALRVDELRNPNVLRDQRRIEPAGDNLVNVYESLSRPEHEEIARVLADRIPVFADVDTRTVRRQQGAKQFIFRDRWRDDVWYTPDEVSDGTILALAYILLGYQKPAPKILAIEEPERGVHPYLLGELVSLMRDLAERDENPIQIILATHSAELLEHVRPEEVRFLSRTGDDGGTIVRTAPVETDKWRDAIAEYENSVGQMWLSGSLGGVPG